MADSVASSDFFSACIKKDITVQQMISLENVQFKYRVFKAFYIGHHKFKNRQAHNFLIKDRDLQKWYITRKTNWQNQGRPQLFNVTPLKMWQVSVTTKRCSHSIKLIYKLSPGTPTFLELTIRQGPSTSVSLMKGQFQIPATTHKRPDKRCYA